MSKVAIAGGTENLGKAVVDAVKAAKHDYIILSRKPHKDQHIVTVDYSDIPGLSHVLEKENIHTVISTMGLYTRAHHESQMNLIEAAELASCTKRFIPSEFGFHIKEEHGDLQVSFPFKLEAEERLTRTGLEFTLINNGVFLDYLAWPQIPSHLRISRVWSDLTRKLAAIPGDGNQMVAFGHTGTLGGDRLTLNQVVEIAEQVTGAVFDKTYDSIEDLSQGKCTLLPEVDEGKDQGNTILPPEVAAQHLAGLGLFVTKGFADLDPKSSIKNIFPHLSPWTVRSAIQKWTEMQ
ncbi:nmra-like family [Fusarium albosuccineum]|uniref:Nmra-like family n=1 Tax=Fusarium albosuccineum TaxID=1237068 RepID=A0A8H4PGB5_9HYPO|nr:nmra-like family [Fusarium albosuccineum]